jgi:hypothetical protein
MSPCDADESSSQVKPQVIDGKLARLSDKQGRSNC